MGSTEPCLYLDTRKRGAERIRARSAGATGMLRAWEQTLIEAQAATAKTAEMSRGLVSE